VSTTGFSQRTVQTNGIRLHVTEAGAGRPVIFCHGFPHVGYIWHRQLRAVAAAGYRAIAPDMRGYGRSDRPEGVDEYTNAKAVGDLTGLLDDMGEEQAVFVGLDFGAALMWELALRAPERVKAVIVCNNPYVGRSRRRPSEVFAKMAGQHFLHLHYFQEPGPADKELDADPRRFLSSIYFALSGGFHYLDIWQSPSAGNGYLDVLPAGPPLPWSWLPTAEFDVLTGEFERTGFTGGLNWYRAMDRNWELMEPLADEQITVPAYFLYGERDCDMEGFSGMDPIGMMRAKVPDLRDVSIIPKAGHLVQLEATDRVNETIIRHLAGL
jgi:pimeloyl-ACP methyl ester carboxylesterase